MHIIDVRWKPVGEGYQPGLSFWDNEKVLSFFPLIPGNSIEWTVGGPRMCIGKRDDFRKMVHCPFDNLTVKRRKCDECRLTDGFDPCIRCTGFSCNASQFRWKECEKSNYVVYLTYFSNGSVKVGVSSARRFLTRWVEQGADYGAIIAKVVGGHIARKLEYGISKKQGIQMAVSGAAKMNTLLESHKIQEAKRAFQDILETADCNECVSELDIMDLNPYYNLSKLDAVPEPWPENSIPIVGQQTLGSILGVKGSLLVTHIGHAYRVVSLKKLIGYTIETSIKDSVITQTGLLDYI